MNKYIGHSMQISGAQEYRLVGGRGDGMRMLRVRNGKGLDFEISLDRAGDIVTLNINGENMVYFASCGYVHPSYYDSKGDGFLKSFTAGFFTTCGLTSVGSSSVDEGEECPLHGTISNTPCERYCVDETDKNIVIKIYLRDAVPEHHYYILERTYTVSKEKNEIEVHDIITNIGSAKYPIMIMYHCNSGYPLLSENAKVVIPSDKVLPRDAHAEDDIENCLKMEKPQRGYVERCYYFDVKEENGIAKCGIYNPDIHKGMVMSYSKSTLDCFTEWKMMGEYEYALGLEPANCYPDGRDVMRKNGVLKFLNPDEEYKTYLKFSFVNDEETFKKEI